MARKKSSLRERYARGVLVPFEQNLPGRIAIKDLPEATLQKLPELFREVQRYDIPLEFFQACFVSLEKQMSNLKREQERYRKPPRPQHPQYVDPSLSNEVNLRIWNHIFRQDAPSADHASFGLNWAFAVSLATLLPQRMISTLLKRGQLKNAGDYYLMIDNYPYDKYPVTPKMDKATWQAHMLRLLEIYSLVIDYENLAQSFTQALPPFPHAIFALGGQEKPLSPEEIEKLKFDLVTNIHTQATQQRIRQILAMQTR